MILYLLKRLGGRDMAQTPTHACLLQVSVDKKDWPSPFLAARPALWLTSNSVLEPVQSALRMPGTTGAEVDALHTWALCCLFCNVLADCSPRLLLTSEGHQRAEALRGAAVFRVMCDRCPKSPRGTVAQVLIWHLCANIMRCRPADTMLVVSV